jgi:hypothetical protein
MADGALAIVGNSHDWSYKYEEGVADPHDFLCYACEEGRSGYVINIRRKLGYIELDEQACRGCMRFLDSIRLFSIPFVRLYSHKGCIRWAISLSDFVEHKTLLTFDPTLNRGCRFVEVIRKTEVKTII